MTFTADQVNDAIEVVLEDESYEDFWYEPGSYSLVIDGQEYTPTKVDETGGMDEGSHATVTFKVGDQLFKKEGYYASHYGYDWDGDLYEVEPVVVKVTEYRRKA